MAVAGAGTMSTANKRPRLPMLGQRHSGAPLDGYPRTTEVSAGARIPHSGCRDTQLVVVRGPLEGRGYQPAQAILGGSRAISPAITTNDFVTMRPQPVWARSAGFHPIAISACRQVLGVLVRLTSTLSARASSACSDAEAQRAARCASGAFGSSDRGSVLVRRSVLGNPPGPRTTEGAASGARGGPAPKALPSSRPRLPSARSSSGERAGEFGSPAHPAGCGPRCRQEKESPLGASRLWNASARSSRDSLSTVSVVPVHLGDIRAVAGLPVVQLVLDTRPPGNAPGWHAAELCGDLLRIRVARSAPPAAGAGTDAVRRRENELIAPASGARRTP